MENTQKAKAERFRKLHSDRQLLILPNIWDTLGAKLIEATGFPAVATASVATALANGYPDGEKLPFAALLNIVNSIAGATSLPLTVDIERGYADDVIDLQANIKLLIENGAVGINIEDGKPGKMGLDSIEEQCRKIYAIRNIAEKCGVPIVINARMDLFLQTPGGNNMKESIARTLAYTDAGADCVYPIMMDNYEEIALLIKETEGYINVNLSKNITGLKKLENMGVSRVSLGPGFLFYALDKLLHLAQDLKQYETKAYFEQEPLNKGFLQNLLFH